MVLRGTGRSTGCLRGSKSYYLGILTNVSNHHVTPINMHVYYYMQERLSVNYQILMNAGMQRGVYQGIYLSMAGLGEQRGIYLSP